MKQIMIRLQDPADTQHVVEVDPLTPVRVVDLGAYLEHGIVVHLTAEVPAGAVAPYHMVQVDTGFEESPSVLRIVPDPHTIN